jgi:hypothetical protein
VELVRRLACLLARKQQRSLDQALGAPTLAQTQRHGRAGAEQRHVVRVAGEGRVEDFGGPAELTAEGGRAGTSQGALRDARRIVRGGDSAQRDGFGDNRAFPAAAVVDRETRPDDIVARGQIAHALRREPPKARGGFLVGQAGGSGGAGYGSRSGGGERRTVRRSGDLDHGRFDPGASGRGKRQAGVRAAGDIDADGDGERLLLLDAAVRHPAKGQA